MLFVVKLRKDLVPAGVRAFDGGTTAANALGWPALRTPNIPGAYRSKLDGWEVALNYPQAVLAEYVDARGRVRTFTSQDDVSRAATGFVPLRLREWGQHARITGRMDEATIERFRLL